MPKNARSGEPTSREAERRKTILRAAIEVFARKGYHGCRIADVAREAGVAYGLVYHYFQNKDELLSSVFEVAWNSFVHRLGEVAAKTDLTLREKVEGMAKVAFEAYRHDPRAVRVLILEVARNPAGAKVNRVEAFSGVIALAEGMFRDAQAKGELRPELDPRLCAALLFGAIEMGLTSFLLGMYDARDEAALQRVQQQISEVFLSGVLGGAAPSEAPWGKDTSGSKSQVARRS